MAADWGIPDGSVRAEIGLFTMALRPDGGALHAAGGRGADGGDGDHRMSRAQAASSVPNLAQRTSRTMEVAFTTVVAWSFGLATAGLVLYAAGALYRGEAQVATPLLAADAAMLGTLAEAKPLGLTFAGKAGAGIAAAMAVGVLAALGMTMMFSGGPRRMGLLMMVGWSGLWAYSGAAMVAGTWNGMGFNTTPAVLAGAAALVLVCGCMIHRMMLLWRIRMVMA